MEAALGEEAVGEPAAGGPVEGAAAQADAVEGEAVGQLGAAEEVEQAAVVERVEQRLPGRV